jgi:hypothetical protein
VVHLNWRELLFGEAIRQNCELASSPSQQQTEVHLRIERRSLISITRFSRSANHLAVLNRRAAEADLGSHWGTLLSITAPQTTGAGTGAAVQARLGFILCVRVLGDAVEKVTLESISPPRVTERPPVPLELRFRNDGTLHEAPMVNIEVRNKFGALVATGTLPVRDVLPGFVRKVEASVGQGFWLGRYTVRVAPAMEIGTRNCRQSLLYGSCHGACFGHGYCWRLF